MNTYEKLQENLKQSMFQKDAKKTSIIRMLISSVRNKELELNKTLAEEDVVAVLRTEAKKVLDSIDQFTNAGRLDLVEKEKYDLDVINSYLPTLLDEESTRKLVVDAIKEVNAIGMKDMGRVMGVLMAKHKGELDGSISSRIVKEELAKL